MKMFKKLAVAAVVATAAASQAGAQTNVLYYTTGTFTGCASQSNAATISSCTFGTTTLTYLANGTVGTPDLITLSSVLPVGSTNYGAWQMTGGSSISNFLGASFTLNVFQTAPSAGSQALVGAITGTVQANGGQLLWGPVTPKAWTIGAINWTLDVDAGTNSVRINPPVGSDFPVNSQTIRGTVTAVPEPSTYALMAAGLAALGMVARRRRNVVVA